MKPRVHDITLAVDDLDRSLSFYRKLGLESPGIIGTEWPGDDENPAGSWEILWNPGLVDV